MNLRNQFSVSHDYLLAYTEGDCWRLAWCLAKTLGAAILLDNSPDTWTHALVHDDDVIDIQGSMLFEDWRVDNRGRYHEFMPETLEQTAVYLGVANESDYGIPIENTWRIAEDIANQLGVI